MAPSDLWWQGHLWEHFYFFERLTHTAKLSWRRRWARSWPEVGPADCVWLGTAFCCKLPSCWASLPAIQAGAHPAAIVPVLGSGFHPVLLSVTQEPSPGSPLFAPLEFASSVCFLWWRTSGFRLGFPSPCPAPLDVKFCFRDPAPAPNYSPTPNHRSTVPY